MAQHTRVGERSTMSLQVNDTTYFSVTEILPELSVTRQTLWRWRQEGKIPAGHRYRDRQVLFTANEVEEIKQFAHRLEPIGRPGEKSTVAD